MKIGAWFQKDNSCEFIVWAPFKNSIEVKFLTPSERLVKLQKDDKGYWRTRVEDVSANSSYYYVIDGEVEKPDPASFYQAAGVHNPSFVFDHNSYQWKDDGWRCMPLEEMIMYELHIGTFTKEGAFSGVAEKIAYLKELGINAVEIMPVAQFPGGRNWGYDGVHTFSVQNTYGGPEEFKKLIDQFHQNGIAVILDVVYNHLGPEGNYFGDFAPYFTNKYHTSWGATINYDDENNSGVRNYFIQNALYWLEYFHIDALRIDAIHGIFDFSEKHILRELSEKVEEYNKQNGRNHYLIAESDLNEVRVIEPKENGGYGINAQWLDDFHNSFRTLITNEKDGYYCDYGNIEQLIKAYNDGFVFDGKYSNYRHKNFGTSSKHIDSNHFVVFTQNHDQVGNRKVGDRLTQIVDFESLKLAAGIMFFSPYIPMIFMGEEFAANTPFLYFISHLDENLVDAVINGRKRDFSAFNWEGEPPNPQDEDTFFNSKLDWDSIGRDKHQIMLNFYKHLISLRKRIPALNKLTRKGFNISCDEEKRVVMMKRISQKSNITCLMNYNVDTIIQKFEGVDCKQNKIIDSSDVKWEGPGSLGPETLSSDFSIKMHPRSFVLYENEK